jgi:iron(III) transport system permease protein
MNVRTRNSFRKGIRVLYYDFPKLAIIAGVGLVLLLLILFPVLMVLAKPRLVDWQELWETPYYLRVIRNTLAIVALSSISATLVGFLFAYAIEKARIPLGGFFRTIAILPLFSPPFVLGLAIIYLFGRNGLITKHLFGVELDVYGLPSLWAVQTLCFFPIAFLTISDILRGINPTIEQAARSLGASRFTIFRTITLPLALPGIGSSILLTAMFVLGDFGNPLIMGGKFKVLAVEAFAQVLGRFNMGMGAVVATLMLLPALLMFVVYQRWEKAQKYATVIGRGSRMEDVPTRKLTRWVLWFVCAGLSAGIIAIYLTIALGAFTKVWGVDWTLTFSHVSKVFFGKDAMGLVPIWNSIKYSAVAGLLAAFFATFSAYIIQRKVTVGRKFLDFLAILPAAIPGTFIGIGYILAFNNPPLVLTGTAAIIVLNMMARSLPVGYLTACAKLQQIHPSIEESAMDLGAHLPRVFKDIIFPLLKTPFIFSFIYTFLVSMNTLSSVIFLVSAGTNLATVFIIQFVERGDWSTAAAMALGTMIVTFSVLAVFEGLVKDKQRGRL